MDVCGRPPFTNPIAYFVLCFAVVPSTPVNLTAAAAGSRTATVSWQEGVPINSVNPAILNFEIYLNDSLIKSTMNTTVVVNNLTPFTRYNINVAARNRIGISNMSKSTLFMTEEEGKLLYLYNHYVYVASFDSTWCSSTKFNCLLSIYWQCHCCLEPSTNRVTIWNYNWL